MMQVTTKESSKAGKLGESTARDDAGKASDKGVETLDAAGVASLLKSEFAGEEEHREAKEPDAGEEAQPAEGAEAEEKEETAESAENAKGAEAGEKEDGEEKTAEGAESEDGEEEEEEEKEEEPAQQELPTELQNAIEQWEKDGGGELPAALQKLVDRRINKLTGQREEERKGRETAESKLKEVETERDSLKAGLQTPPAAVGNLDEKGLRAMEETASSFVQDAENMLDGTATEKEEARVRKYMESEGLDEKGLKRRVREANVWLSRELPEQRAALKAFRDGEAKVEPVAKQFFPWLDKKDSPEYQQAQEILKWMPELKSRVPGHKVALGVYVLGLQAFEELKKLQGKAPSAKHQAPKTKAPAKTPAKGAAAPAAASRNGREQQEESVRGEFSKNPTRENASKLLAMELRG